MSSRGLFLIVLSALLTVAANLLLRTGVVRAGGFATNLTELPNSLKLLISQPLFDLGFLLYALASLVWFQVISTEPLNAAYPLLVSLTFLLVTIGATFFFQESLTFRQLIGLGIIIAGIVFVSG